MFLFYSALCAVGPCRASDTSVILRLGSTPFVLRQRTRAYDGQGLRRGLPGIQRCFRVALDEVEGHSVEPLAPNSGEPDP